MYIVFDFDLTVVNGNTHNTLVPIAIAEKLRNIAIDGDGSPIWHDDVAKILWEKVKHFGPMGCTGESRESACQWWKQLFETLIDDGHKVGFASFSDFGTFVIPYFLEKTIGLDPAHIAKMYINSWLPRNPDTANKNEHIRRVLQYHGHKGNNKEVVFADDSPRNCKAAEEERGYHVILAQGDEWQAELMKVVSEKKQEAEQALPEETKPEPSVSSIGFFGGPGVPVAIVPMVRPVNSVRIEPEAGLKRSRQEEKNDSPLAHPMQQNKRRK